MPLGSNKMNDPDTGEMNDLDTGEVYLMLMEWIL